MERRWRRPGHSRRGIREEVREQSFAIVQRDGDAHGTFRCRRLQEANTDHIAKVALLGVIPGCDRPIATRDPSSNPRSIKQTQASATAGPKVSTNSFGKEVISLGRGRCLGPRRRADALQTLIAPLNSIPHLNGPDDARRSKAFPSSDDSGGRVGAETSIGISADGGGSCRSLISARTACRSSTTG